jgi:PAS domain S-box-containing protein
MKRDSPFPYKRALVIFLVLLFIFLIASNAFLVVNLRKHLFFETEEHIGLSLDVMEAFVREPLLKHDYIIVEQLLIQWAEENEEIREIRAVMPNGFVLADYIREGEAAGDLLTMERKVSFDSRELVSLTVVKSTAREETIVMRTFQLLSLFSVLLTAVLGASLWFVMRRYALQPLEHEIVKRRSTEDKLQATLATLDLRVKKRTEDLQNSYKELLSEIEERKKAENKIRESEEKYKRLTENVTDIIYRFRFYPEPGFDFISKAVFDITGYSPEDLYRDPMLGLQIIHPEDRKDFESFIQGVLPESPHIVRWITRDGHVVWLEDRFTPIFSQDGTLIAVEGISRDITERIKAEEDLRKSEEKYQSLIHNIPSVTWITDSKGNTSFISPNVEEVYGYTPEEIYEAGEALWFGRIHPEDRDNVKKAYHDLFEKGLNFSIEYRIQRKDDRWIWLSDRAVNVFEKDGNSHAYGIFTDMTERKNAEESLKKASFYLDNAGDSIIVISTDKKIRKVNKEFSRLWGYSPEEVLDTNVFKIFPEAEHPKHLSEMELAVSTKKSRNFETVALTKSGREIPLSIRGSAIFNKKGEMEGFIGSFRDITERKRIEEALGTSEEKYRLLFSTERDAVIIVDSETQRIIDANDSAMRLYGYSHQEMLQLTGPDLSAEPEMSEEAIRKMAEETEKKIHYHLRNHKKKDGTTFNVEISSGVFMLKGRKLISAVIRDITERRKAEAEREALLADLELKTKELEQIIYVTSHDLRTPLVNIQGFSKEMNYALDELETVIQKGDVPVETKEKISSIIRKDLYESRQFITGSVSKIDSLISGLLKIARLGRVELHKETIDMNKLLNDVLVTFEFLIKRRGAEIEISELPPCTADIIQINQVFSNLLDNALKYLDQSRPGFVKISGYREKGRVVYSVEDNGVGIIPEYQEKIFDIFHRLEPGEGKGEGLGLSIVKRIIERHRGTLWVESEPGKGSRFFISLPDLP